MALFLPTYIMMVIFVILSKTLDFSEAVDCVFSVYEGLRFLFLAFNNHVNCVARVFFYLCLEWSFDKYLYAVVDCVSYVYEVACFINMEFLNHVDYVACVYCKT